jgi:hypothetical protein
MMIDESIASGSTPQAQPAVSLCMRSGKSPDNRQIENR